jgi:transcriptional regulator with XRE-family HTH domain
MAGAKGSAYCLGQACCQCRGWRPRAGLGGGCAVAGQSAVSLAGLLQQLRAEAKLTQEELAEAAGLSPRSVSDLERGIHRTAHKDTAVLLAGALGLDGPARELFVAAARGRAPAAGVLAAQQGEPPGAFAAAARTLPRDIAVFTGRQAELARLVGAIDGLSASGGVVSIHAIDGMAGIGKTTFAVHAAHRLAERFPDGQFFLPLHAHTAGQRPVDPADGLASLLLAAGVAAAQVPPGLDARAARWRDHVAGRKILLVLDDAVGHEQVRPLLPGTAGSLALITSRRRLAALEDAAVISLDVLPAGEAAALLTRLVGRPGLAAHDAGVGEIAALCGYLPLAIGMTGRQLAHHPVWTPAGLATDLAAAKDRLGMMAAENLSVTAAFGLSYHDLTDSQQRLFRRLGLHPGPDIDAHAAATLDDTNPGQARRGLEDLYDQHLITQPAPGRYRFHDLLREHARILADADNLAESDAADRRLLDYYQQAALAAAGHITRAPGIRPPPPASPPTCAPPLSTPAQAARWLEAERPNLQAVAGRRPGRVLPARNPDHRRDHRVLVHPRLLGSSHRRAADGAGRGAPGRGLVRSGGCVHPAVPGADVDWGHPGRCCQPAAGAGVVPRPRRCARPGRRSVLPERGTQDQP